MMLFIPLAITRHVELPFIFILVEYTGSQKRVVLQIVVRNYEKLLFYVGITYFLLVFRCITVNKSNIYHYHFVHFYLYLLNEVNIRSSLLTFSNILLLCSNYQRYMYQNIPKFNEISQNFNLTNTSLTTQIINKSSKIYSGEKISKDFDIEI